jgi:hypothetical protein
VAVNPGGGDGWDEPPLDIQIPDDARELDREVLAYHRELRAKRRRGRLRRLTGPFAGHGTIMPLLASILAVCLVAGAMLSVATFSPATDPGQTRPPTAAASSSRAVTHRTSPGAPTRPVTTGTGSTGSGSARSAAAQANPAPSATGKTAASARASASAARPSPSGRTASSTAH